MSDIEQEGLTASQFETLTYPHINRKVNTLDDNDLVSACPLDNGHHVSVTPQYDLGTLDVLSLKLLQSVLVQLDMLSLTGFRRLNRRAMEVVDSCAQYKDIVTYAPNTIRGILAAETGRWITCETLFSKLCTAECELCGDFGDYLFIITCRRVCFLCLSKSRSCQPVSYRFAPRHFGLTHQTLDALPHMRIVPGKYSHKERWISERSYLVDFDSAQQAGIQLHGSTRAMERYARDQARQKARESGSNDRTSSVDTPADRVSAIPSRFAAAVQTPVFERSTRELVPGFHCIACQDSSLYRLRHCRRRFTRASFLAHVRECGPIRDGKHWVYEKTFTKTERV